MIEEKKERMFEVSENEVRDYESASPESISYEVVEVEMTTLCELSATNLETQPLSITYHVLDRPPKLNFGFLNLLSKFHGLPGGDPYCHINEFIITCLTMQPDGIT